MDYLLKEGYTIVERNWRLNHLEVDIIATRDDTMAFVEVKTRSNVDADPLEALTPRKRMLLCSAAEAYIIRNHAAFNPRFDVAALTGTEHNHTLDYIEDAFLPPLRAL